MIFKNITDAFNDTAIEYTRLLDHVYPAKGSSGFTERNLTYHFCKNFESIAQKSSGICFSWMEFPLERKKKTNGKRVSAPHLDSVILVLSETRVSVIYIEAKRITENNYDNKYSSIISDIKRVKKTSNRKSVLEHIHAISDNTSVDEYACFLADVWIGNKKRSFEVPDWWKNTLPNSTGQNQRHQTFFEEIKKYNTCSYNLLCLIEQI